MTIDIANIWKYDLRKGNSPDPSQGACLFDAGMWLVYGKIGDNPPCSCPIIRAYAIVLNDQMPNKERQKLKPFILRVVGNRDPGNEKARLHHIILETARRIVPLACDKKKPRLEAEMRKLLDAANAAYVAATAAYVAATTYVAASGGALKAAVWNEAISILDEVLRIGKQSPEFDEQLVIESVKQFENARLSFVE